MQSEAVGAVTQHLYSFGNGATSSLENPTALYRTPGSYLIRQELTGPTGCVTEDSFLLEVSSGYQEQAAPDFYATVDSGHVEITWFADTIATNYQLLRRMDGSNYQLLSTTPDTTFVDGTAAPSEAPYYYMLKAMDACSGFSQANRPVRTIHLSGFETEDGIGNIRWNAFEGWQEGVEKYQLYKLTGSGAPQPLGPFTLPQEYQDHDFIQQDQLGTCYRVKAWEQKGNGAVSWSNKLCISYRPRLYLPNAFSPNGDGINDEFKVEAVGFRSFSISIYNRWGEKIFEAHDPEKSWDGAFSSPSVGIYRYVIEAIRSDNSSLVRSGTIHLLR